jgi:hypothetical protein
MNQNIFFRLEYSLEFTEAIRRYKQNKIQYLWYKICSGKVLVM